MYSYATEAQLYLLLALLVPATVMDFTRHRIPNYLTYPALVLGLCLAALSWGWTGLGNHLIGTFAAGIPLFLIFLSGSLGGGDVKLMAAVGAIVGFPNALNALLASIMVGGLCAALILIWQGRLWGLVQYAWSTLGYRAGILSQAPQPPPTHRDSFPFGVAIAIGSCLIVVPPTLMGSG